MAELTFTPEDLQLIGSLVEEFDPATHPLTRSYLDDLEDIDERFIVGDFLQRSLKRRLLSAFLFDAAMGLLREHGEPPDIEEVIKDLVIDEMSKQTPERPRKLPNGKLETRSRHYVGDFYGYTPMGDFEVNQILQKVNQGKGRGVGECQDRFVSLCDLAIFKAFPQWSQWLTERAIEDALFESAED